jgi:hypothetical protein
MARHDLTSAISGNNRMTSRTFFTDHRLRHSSDLQAAVDLEHHYADTAYRGRVRSERLYKSAKIKVVQLIATVTIRFR